MTYALQLENLSTVRDLMRWLRKPQVGYEWSDRDRFHIVRRDAKSLSLVVELANLSKEEPNLKYLQEAVRCKPAPKKWQKGARVESEGLEGFLRRVELVPNGAGVGTRDLLIAVYGGDPALWHNVYASIPKNPDRRSEVLILSGEDASKPRYLFTVPQIARDFDCRSWLASQRRRFAGVEIRSFYRLPGGITEFYIETGFVHPLPDMREVYRNPERARYFLIMGPSDGTAGRWTAILPGDTEDEQSREHSLADSFEVRLEGNPRLVIQKPTPRAEARSIEWQPRLLPIAESSATRLRTLEQRIHAAKESVFEMETERRHILDRSRERFRFALCFRQDLKSDGDRPPRTAFRFERFLLLSRRQLDAYDYVFFQRKEEADYGYHVVLTREPVFHEDIHSGLAEEVYYQPQTWHDWGLHIFVRDGFELLPRVDQQELANQLSDALGESMSLAEGVVGLVGPAPDETAPFEVLRLNVHEESTTHGDSLENRIALLNVQYSPVLSESIVQARQELLDALDAQKQDLETKVSAMENALTEEAEARLRSLQKLWNEMSVELEKVFGAATILEGHFDILQSIVEDTGKSWTEVLDQLSRIQEVLAEGKLAALERLSNWPSGFVKRIDKTKKANVEVRDRFVEIGERLGPVLGSVKAEHERAVEARQKLEKELARVEPQVRDVQSRLEELRKSSEALLRREMELCERLETQAVEGRAAVVEVEKVTERCRELRDECKDLTLRIEKGVSETTENSAELERQAGVLDGKLSEWRSEVDDAELKQGSFAAKRVQVEGEIRLIEDRLYGIQRESQSRLRELEDKRHSLENSRDQISANLRDAEAERLECERLRQECTQLRVRLKKEDGDRRAQADALEAALSEFLGEARTRDRTITRKLRELSETVTFLAENLRELHRLETAVGGLRDVQADAEKHLASYHDLRDLTEELHQTIWGSLACEGNEK